MTNTPTFGTAIALLEYSSIAAGIEAGDAMAKRAELTVLHAGTVHPGKYLVLVGGGVADVEEALDAADRLGIDLLLDQLFLPDPHPGLVAGIGGARVSGDGEALGIIETRSVSASIKAADGGLKGATVALREIRLADGLGGKGYLLFSGPLVEVEAAVEAGIDRVPPDHLIGWNTVEAAVEAGIDRVPADEMIGWRVIAQLHDEMNQNLVADGRFASRVRET